MLTIMNDKDRKQLIGLLRFVCDDNLTMASKASWTVFNGFVGRKLLDDIKAVLAGLVDRGECSQEDLVREAVYELGYDEDYVRGLYAFLDETTQKVQERLAQPENQGLSLKAVHRRDMLMGDLERMIESGARGWTNRTIRKDLELAKWLADEEREIIFNQLVARRKQGRRRPTNDAEGNNRSRGPRNSEEGRETEER